RSLRIPCVTCVTVFFGAQRTQRSAKDAKKRRGRRDSTSRAGTLSDKPKQPHMKIILVATLILIGARLPAQHNNVSPLNGPTKIAIDSRDNLYVLQAYGIARISPDGQINQFTKGNPNVIGGKFNNSTYLDR